MLIWAVTLGFCWLVLGASDGQAQGLSPLAPRPVWQALEPFQESITHDEFVKLLEEVYAPAGAAREWIDVQETVAVVKTTAPEGTWTLRFAGSAAEAKAVPRFWRTPAQMGPAAAGRPLAGVKIAIDAGHLGGAWAKMEERYFQLGESKPVTEGDMTLRVARLLAPKLQALGADVRLVRDAAEPVTPLRPKTLRVPARAELVANGHEKPREKPNGPDDPARGSTVEAESEILFYRTSEIRHRATIVNDKLRPDLTLCLHFNAEAWGDPKKPSFVPRNHAHVLLNGNYAAEELRHEDVRFDMLMKLLQRCYPEELAAGGAVAAALASETKLPAYSYTTHNAISVGGNGYLWARNLLANRLYRTPVVFLEPYVMNSELVWERVQMGDYEGELQVGGESRKSIYREYADAVVTGLRDYYEKERKAQP